MHDTNALKEISATPGRSQVSVEQARQQYGGGKHKEQHLKNHDSFVRSCVRFSTSFYLRLVFESAPESFLKEILWRTADPGSQLCCSVALGDVSDR